MSQSVQVPEKTLTEVRLRWVDAVPALLAGKQFDEAARVLTEVRERFPLVADVHHWWTALALADASRVALAVDSAEAAVRLDDTNATRHWMLGRAYKANDRLADAEQAYRRALAIRPQYLEAWVSLGITQKAAGNLDGAIAAYREALRVDPGYALAHANLANALIEAEQSGRGSDGSGPSDGLAVALETQRRASSLDPDNVAILANLASLLDRAGYLEEACDTLNRALGIDAVREDLCIHLGGVLFRLNRHAAAESCYRQWLEVNGPSAQVLANLAIVLTETGAPESALAVIDEARELEPDAGIVWQAASTTYMRLNDIPNAIASGRTAMEKGVTDMAAWIALVFALNYVEEQQADVTRDHETLGQTALRIARQDPDFRPLARHTVPRHASGGRLRVGFSSADLRKHSVAYFLEPLLMELDRSRFEVFLYHNGAIEDEVSARLKRVADHWQRTAALPDPVFCQTVRADDIDVLIDLTGYTYGPRTIALAQRCAPVQMVYLGYPTTTGNPSIDFRLTDGIIDPQGEVGRNSEDLLRFASTMFCYGPPVDAPLPRWSGRPQAPTFGSFNNAAKLSDHTLSLWAAVLARVADSRLILKAASLGFESTRARVLARFAEAGVASDRVNLNPWLDASTHHLDLYNQIDVALDCFPYNGATTTCEALWMGTPVASLRGDTHVSRVGASILGACGLDEWVASTDDGFVEIAARLAGDAQLREAHRFGARERLSRSPLLDAAGQAREFARAIEEACARVGR